MFRSRTLSVTFHDQPLVALASAQMLERLLGYLLENASKYVPSAGVIALYGWRAGDRARLAVTDDGPGIPEAWRERIFEPFVRLDDSPRGAGIGLFAARHLARSMGGELTVEPREPYGSQFVLDLAFVGPSGQDRGIGARPGESRPVGLGSRGSAHGPAAVGPSEA